MFHRSTAATLGLLLAALLCSRQAWADELPPSWAGEQNPPANWAQSTSPVTDLELASAATWWNIRPNEGTTHGAFPVYGLPCDDDVATGRGIQWEAIGRGYFADDQRLQWFGQEVTFGVEGVVRGAHRREAGQFEITLFGELFLNQPFDRNILVDQPERRSFRGNFEIEPIEIQQLYLAARRGDLYCALGKMPTPFGRAYFPVYSNSFHDAPFIRTESILWRETGVLLEYSPDWLVLAAAIVNGSADRDTNSSKAMIARVGADQEWFAAGGSVKTQDGIGSDGQKTFKSHAGIDALLRSGCWTLSGEAIYDEYGLKQPLDPNAVTWGRSLYYRDQNAAPGQPLHGVGYYVDLTYRGQKWSAMFNYGEFHPHAIGDPRHDRINRRSIAKVIRHATAHLDLYAMLLVESDPPAWFDGRTSRAWEVLCGLQYAL